MTINGIVWNNPIYDSNTPMALDIATKCIKVMLSTALVARRDFIKFGPADLAAKVAYVKNKPGDINNGVNYMKVRTGRDSSSPAGNIDVAIIYQYLNHRSTPNNASGTGGTPGTWATSVGFSPWLVPDVNPRNPGTIDPNTASYPYTILATAVATQVRADLLSFTPPGKISYIYDDLSTVDPVNPNDPAARRISPIGELGWVAQNNTAIQSLITYSVVRETVPVTSTGVTIPAGYFRAGDPFFFQTTLTTK